MCLFVVFLFFVFDMKSLSLSFDILEYFIYSNWEISHIKNGGQTDKQTHKSAYWVAPQLKNTQAIKVIKFMLVTKSVTSLCAWWLSLVGGDFWMLYSFCPSLEMDWSNLKGQNYIGQSPSTEGGHQLLKQPCKCQMFIWIFWPGNHHGIELRSFV